MWSPFIAVIIWLTNVNPTECEGDRERKESLSIAVRGPKPTIKYSLFGTVKEKRHWTAAQAFIHMDQWR